MAKKSAGILLYRFAADKQAEFLMVHPGGPFFKNKDICVWSVPKGEFDDDEDALSAAIREFKEETGATLIGSFIELKPVKQSSGKTVFCWAMHHDLDVSRIQSNLFSMEWPMKSGKMRQFPEVDKAGWFAADEAKQKIIPGQVPLIDELLGLLKK
jgi:predicted NUDIX family NTP pyrophosphohydrolase